MARTAPGTWAWRLFGKEWKLIGDKGIRPIILGAHKGLHLRDAKHDLLIPFDPTHSDARFIVLADHHFDAAIEALRTLTDLAEYYAMPNTTLLNAALDQSREVLAALEKERANGS